MKKIAMILLSLVVSATVFAQTMAESLVNPDSIDQYLQDSFGFGMHTNKSEIQGRMKEMKFALSKKDCETTNDEEKLVYKSKKPFFLEGNKITKFIFTFPQVDEDVEFGKFQFTCSGELKKANIILRNMFSKWLKSSRKFDDGYYCVLSDGSGAEFSNLFSNHYIAGKFYTLQTISFYNAGLKK